MRPTSVGLRPNEVPASADGVRRRIVEPVVAGAAGIALSPVLLLLAVIVRFTMGAPVLFVQLRAGLGGRTFRLKKFRTMTDARGVDGRLLPDEQRVTRLGRLMRRMRLDEFPELWNIIKGEMAFVGPRPLLPATVASFGEAGRIRGTVRPGLTGWAQVNGNTLLTDDDKLALDLWYIAHRSFYLDCIIVVRTLSVILRGERLGEAELKRARDHARDHCRGS
jgi:lipopolysaccharide/colanic/teichoic acid biosynthesis glycosyltransferase